MSQQAGTADQLDPVEESNMTLMEHLIELRTRLMWVGGAVIIATLVAMIFAWDIVEILNQPLGGYVPQAIGPTDNLLVFFKVALAAGASVAMPVIMYQVIAFIAPGLYPHERRALILILPGAMLLFVVGVLFAFFVMIPPAVRFLQGFGGDNIRTEWTASLYIGFITRITFWIGVAFEAPLLIGFLARIGLVSGSQLLRFWRQAVVIIAIAAAFITPTIDPVNMTIVMGPLIALFFFSVGIAYLLYKPREPRDFSEGFIPEEYRDGHDKHDDDSDDTPPDDSPNGTPPADPEPEEAIDADEDDSADAIAESTEAEATAEETIGEEASEEEASEEDTEPEADSEEATEEPLLADADSRLDDVEEPEQPIADDQDAVVDADEDVVLTDVHDASEDDAMSESASESELEEISEPERAADVDVVGVEIDQDIEVEVEDEPETDDVAAESAVVDDEVNETEDAEDEAVRDDNEDSPVDKRTT